MDNKPRSHGCVLSHPYCSSLQKISSFCLGQYSIPISNTLIRDLNGSPSLHKSVSNSNSSSAHTVYSDSFLARRFSDQGFRSTNFCFPNRNGNSAFSKSGFFDILEEVGVDSFSEFSVSMGTLQNRHGSHLSTRGKICIPSSENSVVPTLSVRNSQTVFSTARFPQLTRGSCSARAFPHSAPTVLSSSTLASSLSRLGSKDLSSSFTVTSPTVVDKQGECDERSITVSTSSYPNTLHRYFQPGLVAYLEGSWALGLWSPLQQREHINLLEMKAVHLALCHSRATLHLKSLVLATDNTTVVAYLKNQRGTRCFSLYSLCREILLLCSDHLNVLADTLSRSLALVNTEWELLQVIFNAISLLWGRPHLDLFATSLNHKLDTFVSPVSDPLAYAVDAMSISCKGMFAYAFPPFRFLSQVLQKVARESCKIILL